MTLLVFPLLLLGLLQLPDFIKGSPLSLSLEAGDYDDSTSNSIVVAALGKSLKNCKIFDPNDFFFFCTPCFLKRSIVCGTKDRQRSVLLKMQLDWQHSFSCFQSKSLLFQLPQFAWIFACFVRFFAMTLNKAIYSRLFKAFASF